MLLKAMDDLSDPEAQRRRFTQRHDPPPRAPTLPTPEAVRAAESSLPNPLSASYLASHTQEDVARHILADLVPAMSGQAASPNYYGFVTGGVLPVAEWADNVVSRVDQNVQVHLPAQSIATKVEAATLEMLVRLLRLDQNHHHHDDSGNIHGAWAGRTFTTGATASNILGLACGREALLARRSGGTSVAEAGILAACRDAGVREIRVLSSAPHSSLLKAASAVGLGRASVVEVALGGAAGRPWKLDLDAVERELQREGVASIVAVSAGEVNTGRYALDDVHEWERLRRMADEHGAWIHLDGAFGIFSRVLDERDEYQLLHVRNQGFHLADSIALDGHKLLNVPYDCGVFLTRSPSLLQSVFQNPNAAYLAPSNLSGPSDALPSPLHVGIENSRRFRALPVYAALLSEGRAGFAHLVHNMVQLSRRVAGFLRDSPHYELLPAADNTGNAGAARLREIFMIVLFRARDRRLNDVLVERINSTREVYVSGTTWAREPAVRIAVSSWRVDVERDAALVTSLLARIAATHEAAHIRLPG